LCHPASCRGAPHPAQPRAQRDRGRGPRPLARARPAAGGRMSGDPRLHYRVPVLQLGLAVTLGPEAAPALTIPGRLIDLSAGGCYLAAPRDLGLTPGSACRVGLPVTPGGLTP